MLGQVFTEIKAQTLEDWLDKTCSHGDRLQVIKAKQQERESVCNVVALKNLDSKQLFMVKLECSFPKDGG